MHKEIAQTAKEAFKAKIQTCGPTTDKRCFGSFAALFRFSFQLAIPEVKSENDASPTPQKKKTLIWWAIELENFK